MQKILGKLHNIMSKVDFIAKDKKNEFHNYEYASEEAIKKTLHPLLVKEKVLFSLTTVGLPQVNGEITSQDFHYRFFDIESGESLEGSFVGQGQDKGDKGIYKAITGAIKYILTSTFLIPTGLDPENEEKPEVVEKKRPKMPAGEILFKDGHYYCPNCGSKAKHREGMSKRGAWEGIQCSCTKGVLFFDKNTVIRRESSLEVPNPPDFAS